MWLQWVGSNRSRARMRSAGRPALLEKQCNNLRGHVKPMERNRRLYFYGMIIYLLISRLCIFFCNSGYFGKCICSALKVLFAVIWRINYLCAKLLLKVQVRCTVASKNFFKGWNACLYDIHANSVVPNAYLCCTENIPRPLSFAAIYVKHCVL